MVVVEEGKEEELVIKDKMENVYLQQEHKVVEENLDVLVDIMKLVNGLEIVANHIVLDGLSVK